LLKFYPLRAQETDAKKILQLGQRIEHAENRINLLVYELYALTDEEIEMIDKM